MTLTKTTTYHSGTLYRQDGPRKSTKWLMRLYTAEGYRVSRTTGTHDEVEARRILDVTLGEVALGRPVPARGKESITFEDGVDLIRQDYRVKGKKSIGDVLLRINNHVRPFFGTARSSSVFQSASAWQG